MVANEGRNKKTVTRTTEYGSFIRKKTVINGKRRQKTVKLGKNPEKVTLCKIGDIEVYVYPKDYPDKVFLGLFPMNAQLEQHQIGELFRAYNKIRWFFENGWENDNQQTKEAKLNRQRIVSAYNCTLEREKKLRKG